VRLVWHASDLMETDWIRDILGDLVEEEQVDLSFRCFDENTIHVISNNTSPLPSCDAYFTKCRARCKRIALIHVSDEYLSGGYRLYRHFDAVIRHGHTYLTKCPGIVIMPLGYAKGARNSNRPADCRPYLWSFTGQVKASRRDMINELSGLHPALVVQTPGLDDASGKRLTKAEYNAVLEDTIFSPSPMGNAVLETWRLYESLESGCIPLVERRLTMDYYTNLLGPNPIPVVHDWREARDYIRAAVADKAFLLRLQGEIRRWWDARKAAVRDEVRSIITGPSYQADLQRYGELLRNRSPLLFGGLRVVELLRHQNGSSLRRRLLNPTGPLRRMAREGTQRFSQAV
jgi:hypothetical protein